MPRGLASLCKVSTIVSATGTDSGRVKQNYLVIPLVCMAAFAGYYFYWQSQSHGAKAAAARVIDPFANRDGKKEAESLLADGKLVFIETGPAVSWDAERRELARSRYDVEIRRFDDAATEGFARYVDAFNRVMRAKILARHGRGFFDQLHREAIDLQKARTEK